MVEGRKEDGWFLMICFFFFLEEVRVFKMIEGKKNFYLREIFSDKHTHCGGMSERMGSFSQGRFSLFLKK